jgi:GAF domain-containing protein
MAKLGLKSVEDVSVMRKFSIFFVLLSATPFILLAVLFFILHFSGEIELNSHLLFWSFLIVGFFMFISFLAIRSSLSNIKNISQNVKGALEGELPKHLNIKGKGENEIIQIARSFNEVVQRLEGTIKELEKSKSMLQDVLTKVASGVSFTENINAFLDLIMKTTVGALNAKTGLLLFLGENNKELILRSSYGFPEDYLSKERHFSLEIGALDWVIKQKKPLLVPHLQKHSSMLTEDMDPAFMPPLICVPLIFQNEAIGVIVISGQGQGDNFKEDDLIILSNISSQMAMAIVNAKLNADAQRTYLETITALALAVEARDVYSRGHSDRVGIYSVKIAQKLGLNEQLIKNLKEAAQLHDVGKIGIADEILRKPGPLNDFEFEIMRQHPAIGEGIIIPLRGFTMLRDPIRHHHEWLNGEGYPDHLKGDQISIITRILTIADAYDAMTSERPYRKALSTDAAKAELAKYKDSRYDPKVVNALIESV